MVYYNIGIHKVLSIDLLTHNLAFWMVKFTITLFASLYDIFQLQMTRTPSQHCVTGKTNFAHCTMCFNRDSEVRPHATKH